MRILRGLVLLMTGLFVAVAAYNPQALRKSSAPVQLLAARVEPAGGLQQEQAPAALRIFSPVPLVAATRRPADRARPVAEASDPASWKSIVTVSDALDTQLRRIGQAKRETSMDSYELARALQRELRRVGCYYGEIDGSWGVGSKRAMSEFTDRINALLPVENPDHILLMLVEGREGRVCGSTCPSGQVLSETGRCLPTVIVAQTEKPVLKSGPKLVSSASYNQPLDSRVSTPQIIATARPEPLPGRMSIGGPVSTLTAPPSDASRTALLPEASAEDKSTGLPVLNPGVGETGTTGALPPSGSLSSSAGGTKTRAQNAPDRPKRKSGYASRYRGTASRGSTVQDIVLRGISGVY